MRGSRRVPFLSSSVGPVLKPSPDERSPDKQPGDKRHVSVARDIRRWTVMDGGRVVGEEDDGSNCQEMRTRGVRRQYRDKIDRVRGRKGPCARPSQLKAAADRAGRGAKNGPTRELPTGVVPLSQEHNYPRMIFHG